MPRAPLIRSQRSRDRTIAAVMLCVLLASLAAAMAVAAQRRVEPIPMRTRTVFDLSFSLPDGWRQVEWTGAPPRVAPIRFVDADRPTRTLMLQRITTPSPLPPDAVLMPVVQGLMRSRGEAPAQTVFADVRRQGSLVVAQWLAFGPARDDADAAAVHLAANLTGDGHVHWLLYLSDQTTGDEEVRTVLRRNVRLLRDMIKDAEITAEPEPGAAADADAAGTTHRLDRPTGDASEPASEPESEPAPDADPAFRR